MKNLLLAFIFIPAIVNAQQGRFETRHIEVWGKAERIVVPDEIFTSITLKEYKAPNKKVSLDHLEKQLVKAVASAKIPEENLRVENIYGYNWDWKKKKSDEFLASKTFVLKTSDLKKLNDLLASLDPEGLHRVYVKRYTHSNLESIEKELQLEALKDARDKAKVLVNGIDEALGGVLEIQEMQHAPYYGGPRMDMMEAKAADSYESQVEFQEIKVMATVRAVFEID